MERKYYEVWGDNLALLNLMRWVIILLAFALIGMILLLRIEKNRLPIVVKVDSLGKPEVVNDWRSLNAVSWPEVQNFTETFMENYTAWNYYTWDENFRKAFKMMTMKYQQTAQADLAKNQIDVEIQKAEYKTKIYISEPYEKIVDAKDSVRFKIKGVRTYESYLNKDFKKEIIFESEFVLKKVIRGQKDVSKKNSEEVSPWGLLVDYYNETPYNK